MTKLRAFLRYWIPVIAWAGLIFGLSSIPGFKSDLPATWDLIARKVGHMIEFGVLMWLLFRALRGDRMPDRNTLRIFITEAAIFAFFYSITDEWHQTFVAGREGLFSDVLIDAIGIAFASLILMKTKPRI